MKSDIFVLIRWEIQVGSIREMASKATRFVLAKDVDFLISALDRAYSEYIIGNGRSHPSVLITSLIAAEDHRFYKHSGVDARAILRAVWYSLFQGHLVGGSTLEQQLVRTLTRRKEKTVVRKLREMALALVLEASIPKADIPGLYLSVAYFGWRMSGLNAGCARLGIDINKMTQRQAAGLVARLKYPEPYNASVRRHLQINHRIEYIISKLEGGIAGQTELSGAKDCDAILPVQ